MSAASDRLWPRWAAISGILAPLLFTILYLVLGLITPGYNSSSQTISELGQTGQAYAVFQDANFVITGLLAIGFVIGLYKSISHSQISRIGAVLLLAYPVAFVLVGTVFPLPSPVHVPLGSLSFFLSLVGLTITAWPMRREASPIRLYRFTLITGVGSIVGFFVYGLLQSQGIATNWLGLIQRVELAPYFIWIEVVAARLFSISRSIRRQAV